MMMLTSATSKWMSVKLNPDKKPGAHISRVQLKDRLCSNNKAKVTLVKAHAGFGKSTLLYEVHQHLSHFGVKCIWLNIDRADNDLARFVTVFATALKQISPLSGSIQTDVAGKNQDANAVNMLEMLSAIAPPYAIFIDDMEHLHSPSVFILLRQIVNALPLGARLIIGTRTLPDLGIARLRSQGDLLEVGANELRFSPEEISSFFAEQCDIFLSEEQISRFYANTEGWPVAVKLASMALQSAPDRSNLITEFTGSNAMVADYLSEEVFSNLPSEVKLFLLRTSILHELNSEICDHICNINDSQSRLEELDQSNVFVVPLDSNRSQFRYHSLFSRFLQDQLKKQMPNEKQKLHKMASQWYLQRRQVEPALEQALASNDMDFALPLLAQHVSLFLNNGRPRLVLRLIESLDSNYINAWTELKVAHIWAVSFTRGAEEALSILSRYEQLSNTTDEFTFHGMALRPTLLSIMDRHVEAYQYAMSKIDHFPLKYSFAKDMLSSSLAYVSLVMGKVKEAHEYLDGISGIDSQRSNFTLVYAQCVEGAIEYIEGQLQLAKARFEIVNQVNRSQSHFSTNGNAMAGVLLATVLYERAEYQEAERLLHFYVPFLREQSVPDHLMCGYRCLVRIYFSRGDVEHAHQALVELEHTGYRNNLPRLVSSAHLERSRIALLQGEKETALAELERAKNACDWRPHQNLRLIGSETEQLDIGELRWEIYFGNAAKAVKQLKICVSELSQQNRQLRLLKINILLAMALHASNKEKEALRVLEKVLKTAIQQGFVRLLLDEGCKLVELLRKLVESNGVTLPPGPLANALQYRPPKNHEKQQQDTFSTQTNSTILLTKKESAVLNLLAEGLSNANIAERLFVSTNTVRTHLRNINAKLNTQSRTETIVVARKSGLLH